MDHLLTTAVAFFGRYGFEGASTRAIAAAAGKPMSAITYHFGGKSGLYLAAARHIGEELYDRMAPALAVIDDLDLSAGVDSRIVHEALSGLIEVGVAIVTDRDLDDVASFIVQEQAEPTEAFEIIYTAMMEPLLRRIVTLLRAYADPAVPDERLRLQAVMLVGQIMAIRYCRATVARFMGWAEIGSIQCAELTRAAHDALNTVLAELRNGVPA